MAGAAGTLTRSGTFVWEELITSDVAGAREFYGALFGWKFEEGEMPDGGPYVMFGPSEQKIGGLMSREGVPLHWATYVGVDSADDAAAKAIELGATVLAEPFEVPGVGRMAVIQDPTGPVIQVWESIGGEGNPPEAVHGTVAWREVRTPNIDKALSFYTEWLGWISEASDMGEFVYHVFHKGELPVAGAMGLFGDMANIPPHWAVTFNVDDVAATVAKAKELGAELQMAPDDIPGVGTFAAMQDPQGVSFGIMKWSEDRN